MIYCQSCLTRNPPDVEFCKKCGTKLMVLGGSYQWEEPDLPRLSMNDHFLERISNLEETVNSVLEHLSRLAESVDAMDRNAFVTRSGLASLVETLRESRLLREELLYQRWETTMAEQMEEARLRERFTQMKGRFIALYRGEPKKKASFQAHIDEADFLVYSDRFPEGIESLIQAFKLDTHNYELGYYLAEHYQQQGMNREARYYLTAALDANPDHFDALLLLGLLAYGEDDLETSQRLLTRCLEIRPHHPTVLLSLGSIYTSDHRYEEAAPLLERAVELDPQAQSFYLLGLCARERGKIKTAIDCFKNAVEFDPEHEEAVFALGMAYLERGWTRKAQACFSQAIELNPNNLEYQESAAGGPEPVTVDSPDLDPESLKVLHFAEELFRGGKHKQALPHYRQLIRKYPANYTLLSGYAALNFSMRRHEETLKMTRKILSLQSPERVRCVAYTLQMESFRALNRYDEAIESLNVMLHEFPEGAGRAIAHYGLAITKADLGSELNIAEELANVAVDSSPPEFRHNALDALGWVYFKQGRYEEALKLLESALSMHESVNHLYHYGMVLLALNLREEAFKVFERTVKLKNRHPIVDDFILSSIEHERSATEEDFF